MYKMRLHALKNPTKTRILLAGGHAFPCDYFYYACIAIVQGVARSCGSFSVSLCVSVKKCRVSAQPARFRPEIPSLLHLPWMQNCPPSYALNVALMLC